jgi:hypothetical protein
MALQLIDGYRNDAHISSQQVADANMAVVGDGDYIFGIGEQFRCELVSNNLIRVFDGCGMSQGRRFLTPRGEFDELTIDSGTPGATRRDLIVFRYTIDLSTHVEDMQLVVVKGTANAGDPVINDATVVRDGAAVHDFPLYRVRIDGITVGGIDQLFETAPPYSHKTEIPNQVVPVTLLAESWVSELLSESAARPTSYYRINDDRITGYYDNVEVELSKDAAAEQKAAFKAAVCVGAFQGDLLNIVTQHTGYTYIIAKGGAPDMDIPVMVSVTVQTGQE